MEGILVGDGTSADVSPVPFEALEFSCRGLNLPRNMYHVYRSVDEFEEVEANSAYEAMRESGIEKPYCIRRQSVHRLPIIEGSMLTEQLSKLEESVPETAEVEVVADSADAAVEAVTKGELSAADTAESEVALEAALGAEEQGADEETPEMEAAEPEVSADPVQETASEAVVETPPAQ